MNKFVQSDSWSDEQLVSLYLNLSDPAGFFPKYSEIIIRDSDYYLRKSFHNLTYATTSSSYT